MLEPFTVFDLSRGLGDVYKRLFFFFFQAEDGIRDRSPSRGLGDVYKRQYMDDMLLSAPTVNSAITDGKAIISGDFDNESAETLAAQIRAGSLPFLSLIHI